MPAAVVCTGEEGVIAPSDEQLLRDHLAGQDGAFARLVQRYAPELYQFVLRFTRSAAAAEDIVQETLLQLHAAAPTFDPGRRLKPWVFTIAANKARDYIRRRDRRREVPLQAEGAEPGVSYARFEELISTPADAPEDAATLDERRQAVSRAIDAMPVRLSEVLVLAYFHRLPYREIGEVLGLPIGTVKSRLHSAIVFFAEQYRAELRDTSGQAGEDPGKEEP